MNVTMWFDGRTESVESFAVGGAAMGRARIEVRGSVLALVSESRFVDETDDGYPAAYLEPREEVSGMEELLDISPRSERTLAGFLDAAGEMCGLRRFDVDGETLWESWPDGNPYGGGLE